MDENKLEENKLEENNVEEEIVSEDENVTYDAEVEAEAAAEANDADPCENQTEGMSDTVGEAETAGSSREYSYEEFDKILKKQRRYGVVLGVLISIILASIITITVYIVKFASSKESASNVNVASSGEGIINQEVVDKSEKLWGMIEQRFLWEDDINAEEARNRMYKALLESLGDPYSVYYTKEEFDELLESSSGEYSGIGAYVAQDPDSGATYISRPMPGSPAEEAGVQANDYIITIDGEEVAGQDLSLVVSKIKGPEGTTVDIGFKHNNEGDVEVITIERRTIEVAMLQSEMLEDDIGYIWVYEFEQKTLPQFKDAYQNLKDDGMKGLIIDLRDNPGGDLDVVCNMADIFLDEGIICYTKDRKGAESIIQSNADKEDIPIVIITNGNSASASEILTGSLKDRGVATVVGTNTFGKGIVQGLYSLSDGTGVKFTESEYYLPNNECIHGVGIAPDYEVELDYDAFKKDGTDAQKDKAIEVMKGLIK